MQRVLVLAVPLLAAPLAGCAVGGICDHDRFELDGELSVGDLRELGLEPGEGPGDAACEEACDLVLADADVGYLDKLKECTLIVDEEVFVEGMASDEIAGRVRCRGRMTEDCK